GSVGSDPPNVGSMSIGCPGSTSAPGHAGGTVGVPDLREVLLFGGAGGEGGADDDSVAPGRGGDGGGIILLFAPVIAINGTVDVSGDDGRSGLAGDATHQCARSCGAGGGGGGAGGALYFVSNQLSISGFVTALGGMGGSCSCNVSSAVAGVGGVGRIAIRAASITGMTTPPYFSP